MEMIPQNTIWLIPEEVVPCELFLYFRGQYVQGIAAKSPVSYKFLEKITQAKLKFIYIRKSDLNQWLEWQASRNQFVAEPKISTSKGSKLTNKRPELLSYLRKTFTAKSEEDKKVVGALEKAFATLTEATQSSVLDWYFQQFHEPPDLFFHNGRVALLSLYLSHYSALLGDEDCKNMAISTLIHELEGDPAQVPKSIASEVTLKIIEKAKHPFPKEIIQLIQVQDEFCDGTGFPNGITADKIKLATKIFSLVNQFDHARLREGGTRKSRYERSKQKINRENAHFDPSLLQKLWECCENQLEIA